jgi:ribokinase
VGSIIHVIGSLMVDRVSRVRALPRAGETVAAHTNAVCAGGKGANQAAAAAKCGACVRMLGRTGRDGAFIVDALREAGVATDEISTADAISGTATVLVADTGENAIVIAPESNARIHLADIEAFLARTAQGDIVLFQNECSCLHEGIALAASRALHVWLNAAPADARLATLKLEKLTGLVVNEPEAEALTGERDPARALDALAVRMPAATVIVTLGASGAIAALGRARYAHRGFTVDAVDTVGCGDAFVGAYLAAIAEGRDIAQALARANAAGALAAMREGAMQSLPSREEVEVAAALPERTRLTRRPPADAAPSVPSRCARCGYDLMGKTPGERCPECGVEVVATSRSAHSLDGRSLARLARAARLLFAASIVVALAPAMELLDGLAAYAAVFIFALVQIPLQCVATLMLASFATDRLRRRRTRDLAIGRAAALALGQLVYPAMALSGWILFYPLLDLIEHPHVAPLFVLPAPLLVLTADAILLWWLRDVVAVVGTRAAQPWRGAASKARIGILLTLPVATLFAPVGFTYLSTMWGVCLALGALELLSAATAAMRRLEAGEKSTDAA